MKRIERIKKLLKEKFSPLHLIVKDKSKEHAGHNNFNGSGETHIYIEVGSRDFANKKTIDIHRKINLLLKKEFKNGLHALEIKIINY